MNPAEPIAVPTIWGSGAEASPVAVSARRAPRRRAGTPTAVVPRSDSVGQAVSGARRTRSFSLSIDASPTHMKTRIAAA